MFFPLCAAFAASSLISKGLAASWRLLEPPHSVWVVPGNPCWVTSVPQVGELCWKQWSTTNPAADIIDVLKKGKAQAFASFWAQEGVIRWVQLPKLPVCSWSAAGEQSFQKGDNISAEENVLWCCGDSVVQEKKCYLQCFSPFPPS